MEFYTEWPLSIKSIKYKLDPAIHCNICQLSAELNCGDKYDRFIKWVTRFFMLKNKMGN